MREFFQGWRRKAGLVTLAMACVLATVWMRSQSKADCVVLPIGKSVLCNFASDQFGLRFVWTNRFPNPSSFSTNWTSQPLDRLPKRTRPLDENSPSYEWNVCGVHFGSDEVNLSRMHFGVCVVPYCHVVLPLTLLSAWLLLIKPRPAKSAKESSRA